MPKYLVLPKIGMNMEEGVIDEWLVAVGDYVEKEQMVVRAETDKSVQDMFATESGIVYKLLVGPGDVVPCQGKIAILLEEGEEPPTEDGAAEAPKEEKTVAKEEVATNKPAETTKAVAATSVNGRIRISPLARKLAKEFNIPIETISPSKEGARIVKADVLKAKEEGAKAPKAETTFVEPTAEDVFIPFSNIRKVIAKRMTESVNTQPRLGHVTTVNCTELVKWRELLKQTQKVTYNELIMKACATALRKNPELNVLKADGGMIQKGAINIGFAVDTPKGLIVPVVKNVDKKGVFAVASEFADLADKAKSGKLGLDEMTGGTFSISNLGMYGVESFDPILNTPECFILGIGSMIDTPVVKDGEIKIEKCMKITLCFDHAIIDGAPAARLLQEIRYLLENPVMMLA